MKRTNLWLLLLALLGSLSISSTLPRANAQQASTTSKSVTFRMLELPTEFRNSASFVEWAYQPDDDTLQIGSQPAGIVLLSKKWHEGGSLWLPIGLNERGSQNLQLQPCRDGSQSVIWEPYNDSANWLLVDESVLNVNFFTITLYTDDANNQGAGQKLVLDANEFASARSVEMVALAAPADSFGKISGISSSITDNYNLIVEDLGGLWLGNNGTPSRGVGLNQGEKNFTSAQVPPCQPAGSEFVNDLGDAVVLLPRETACTDGLVTLWENDLDGNPSGLSWPMKLGLENCSPIEEPKPPTFGLLIDCPSSILSGATFSVTTTITSTARSVDDLVGYTAQLSHGNITRAVEVSSTTVHTFTAMPLTNTLTLRLLVNGDMLDKRECTVMGQPTDNPPEQRLLFLPLMAAQRHDPCVNGQLVISYGQVRETYAITSSEVLSIGRMPLETDVTFEIAGGPADAKVIMDQPFHRSATGSLTIIFESKYAAKPLLLFAQSDSCGFRRGFLGSVDP